MPPKNKRQKQAKVKVEKLILSTMPEPEKPEPFYTIQPPEPYHFPIEETLLEGIQLVEHYFPKQINKQLDPPFMLDRMMRHKGKFCFQGLNKGMVVPGMPPLPVDAITASAYGPNYLILAHENRSLAIYGLDFRLIKEIRNFTDKRITHMKILDTPAQFQGIVLVAACSTEVYLHRIEKSFFSTFSLKLSQKIVTADESVVQINEVPKKLRGQLSADPSYANCNLFSVLSLSQIWVVRINNSRLTQDNFYDIVTQKQHNNPSKHCFASWGEAFVSSREQEIEKQQIILIYSFGHNLYLSTVKDANHYLNEEKYSSVEYKWIESWPIVITHQQAANPPKQKQKEKELKETNASRKDKGFKTETAPVEKAPPPQQIKVAVRNVVFCQHIKKQEILLVLEDNQIYIIYVAGLDLFEKTHRTFDMEIISYSICAEPLKARKIKSEGGRFENSYAESFLCDFGSNEVYFITEQGKLGVYVYCNWKQICEIVKSDSDNFSSAMNFLIALYKKANRFDLGLKDTEKDRQELEEYIRNISIEYIKLKYPRFDKEKIDEQSILNQLEEKFSDAIDIILTPIELLTNTDQFQFLFLDFKARFCYYLSERIFYKALEPFIEHGRIKYVPDTELKHMLDYYLSEEKVILVQRLIIYVDLQRIEKGILIQCCLDNNLAVSLAFVCTQGNDGEFVTPFIKFWGMAEDFKNKGEFQNAHYSAIRALWYVKLCLQRSMALRQYSYQRYGYLVRILTAHFFTVPMITGFMQIRMEACLLTLIQYFNKQNSGIVNQYCKLKCKQQVPLLPFVRPKPKEANNETLERMLAMIYECVQIVKKSRETEEQRNEDTEYFEVFLSRVIILQTVFFEKQKYLQLIKYLILNYHLAARAAQFDQGGEDDSVPQEAHASVYIDKLIGLAGVTLGQKLTYEELQDLYGVSRLVPLTDLQAQINFLCGNYGTCVDIFLRAERKAKIRVFKFLERSFITLKLQQKKKDRKILEKEVKERISQLVDLSPEMTVDLIRKYLPDSQEELIVKLDNNQGLQLEYLEIIVNNHTRVSQQALLKYVELMCQLKPQSLLESFKKNSDFPVEESLRICEEYSVYDCMEYLYERMGNIEESVKIAALRIDQIVQHRNDPIDENEDHPYVKIDHILSNVIDVCIKNHAESVWESLFDSAVAMFNKYKGDPEGITVFYDINAKILYEMLGHCSVEHSIYLIKQKYSDLDMGGRMSGAFIEILNNFNYSENIMFSASNLQRSTLAEYMELSFQKNIRSYPIAEACNSCGEPMDKTQHVIGFYCGHSYHKECVADSSTEGSSLFCIRCLSFEENQFNLFIVTNNPQNPKVNLDKLREEYQQLKENNLNVFKDESAKYVQKQLEQETQNKNEKVMDKLKRYQESRILLEQTNLEVQKTLERNARQKNR